MNSVQIKRKKQLIVCFIVIVHFFFAVSFILCYVYIYIILKFS